MTDPVQQDYPRTDAEIIAYLDRAAGVAVVSEQADFGPPPQRRPLGRVARIFHRRGMWSLSADMLAQSEDEP